jgi:hypothetical protein
MRNRIVFGVTLALGLAAAAVGTAHAQMYGYGMMGPGYGPGMMGPGYGPGMMYGRGYGMMGPGMMYGPGYGPGMMGPPYGPGMMYGPGYGMSGPGWFHHQRDLNISTDDAKNYFERWIAIQGNTRLKVGDVKEKDADSIVVDIVTKEGNSLVQRFLVNRHSGFYQPEQG